MGLPLDPETNPDATAQSKQEGANQVLSGSFAAQGVSAPITAYGQFNFALWGSATYNLTLRAGSAAGAIDSAVLLQAGQSITAVGLPPGATIYPTSTVQVGGFTSVQIGGLSTVQIGGITAGTVAATLVGPGITPTATVSLERTFDGGQTWLTANIGGNGGPATYELGSNGIDNPVNVVAGEPERQMGYRFNCSAFSGIVNVHYRLSITGLAAMTWGIPGNG